MTFREIIDSGAGQYLNGSPFQQAGIEVFENTPDEITANAMEMADRFEGKWQSTNEDNFLQSRFWDLWKPNELNHEFLVCIGAEYLRKNIELLA